MLKEIDHFYFKQQEPLKSCFAALRQIILQYDPAITEAMKYKMPFFCLKGKMFCYLWKNKITGKPYIGIVEGKRIDHPALIMEKRARMKIMLIDESADIPVDQIYEILKMAAEFYK